MRKIKPNRLFVKNTREYLPLKGIKEVKSNQANPLSAICLEGDIFFPIKKSNEFIINKKDINDLNMQSMAIAYFYKTKWDGKPDSFINGRVMQSIEGEFIFLEEEIFHKLQGDLFNKRFIIKRNPFVINVYPMPMCAENTGWPDGAVFARSVTGRRWYLIKPREINMLDMMKIKSKSID